MATGAIARNPETSETYSYSSHPRVIQQQPKYRDGDPSRPCNIMYDKRVVRGNTYALHTLPASSQPNPVELQKQQETKRRVLAHKRARDQMRIRSPPPVDGRKHTDVQTELYLEEITDRIEEADVHTQTDAFLDRPPTPLFIPAKTGMDIATQIEDGDLFNFDLEVQPILEVLIGKTVEQSLLEVMEEEELAALREQQRIFEGNRNAELVETQRLEEQERRRREEKERRMQQQREAIMKEKETAEKVAARAFAHGYLSDLVPAVFTNLSDNGFFYDPIQRNIETAFIPWLMDETEKLLDKKLMARNLLDALIRQVVRKKLGIVSPVSSTKEFGTNEEETNVDLPEDKTGPTDDEGGGSAITGEQPPADDVEKQPVNEEEKPTDTVAEKTTTEEEKPLEADEQLQPDNEDVTTPTKKLVKQEEQVTEEGGQGEGQGEEKGDEGQGKEKGDEGQGEEKGDEGQGEAQGEGQEAKSPEEEATGDNT